MKLQAVIGANYGDEGKGLVTDYLSSPSSLVVRFNGGSQAGHTVVSGTKRHVFSHLGSGAFQRADTFLSRFFIVNPLQFYREYLELSKIGIEDRLFVDPRCIVTTPIDMMINQAVETARSSRHGSCGQGINETVQRSLQDPSLRLEIGDSEVKLVECLQMIRYGYLPFRLKELGIDDILPNAKASLDHVLDDFVKKFKYFTNVSRMEKFDNVKQLVGYDKIVFEGAQGLLLDMDSPDFPYVTRSKTGLHNVLTLLSEAGLPKNELEAFFVSRIYLTRHGPGPLPNELARKPYDDIVDKTNVPNQWQGTIRYGLLDPYRLAERIKGEAGDGLKNFNLVLTCVDQVDGPKLKVSVNGKEARMAGREFCDIMRSHGIKDIYMSTGPTRRDLYKTIKQEVQHDKVTIGG